MKKVALFILVLGITLSVVAQNKNCSTPMSNNEFNMKFNEFKNLKDDQAKLTFAKGVADTKCFLVEQVKKMAELFEDDIYRLDFSQAAYISTVDRVNFYEVIDVFRLPSSMFKLYDFVRSEGKERKHDKKPNENTNTNNTNTNTNNSNNTTTAYKFIAYDYPDQNKYTGAKKCNNCTSDGDFEKWVQQVLVQKTDDAKFAVASEFIQKNCVSTSQVMKIATLIGQELKRVELLKNTYDVAFDPDNFDYSKQVITDKKLKAEFIEFLKQKKSNQGKVTVNNNQAKPCAIPEKEYNEVKGLISKQSFNNTKIDMFKKNIIEFKCISIDQIKDLLGLFAYENEKLDLSKFAYDYCSEKQSYMKVTDIFKHESSKSDLIKFMDGKK